MKIEVVGKNGFTPSEANKEYAEKKLAKLQNYLSDYDNISARVVCKVYKDFHKVEVTIPSKNIILRAEVSANDIYSALDLAIDKLVKQIRRYNDKIKDKMGREGIKNSLVSEEDERVVRKKEFNLQPMSVEEAIDQMEALGHDFFIYLDKSTRKTNVIYLRADGGYAVIETDSK